MQLSNWLSYVPHIYCCIGDGYDDVFVVFLNILICSNVLILHVSAHM